MTLNEGVVIAIITGFCTALVAFINNVQNVSKKEFSTLERPKMILRGNSLNAIDKPRNEYTSELSLRVPLMENLDIYDIVEDAYIEFEGGTAHLVDANLFDHDALLILTDNEKSLSGVEVLSTTKYRRTHMLVEIKKTETFNINRESFLGCWYLKEYEF